MVAGPEGGAARGLRRAGVALAAPLRLAVLQPRLRAALPGAPAALHAAAAAVPGYVFLEPPRGSPNNL